MVASGSDRLSMVTTGVGLTSGCAAAAQTPPRPAPTAPRAPPNRTPSWRRAQPALRLAQRRREGGVA